MQEMDQEDKKAPEMFVFFCRIFLAFNLLHWDHSFTFRQNKYFNYKLFITMSEMAAIGLKLRGWVVRLTVETLKSLRFTDFFIFVITFEDVMSRSEDVRCFMSWNVALYSHGLNQPMGCCLKEIQRSLGNVSNDPPKKVFLTKRERLHY